MPNCVLIVIFLILFALPSLAGTAIFPTTTLTTETSNNTSASSYFTTSVNGNASAGNVSKENIRKLLPEGVSTKAYAHFMPWFGESGHIDVGYQSADRAQVKRQIDDMMSRGIDGAIIDWYGPQITHHNLATLYMRDEAETRSGRFKFAIMEDRGALGACLATEGCDVTQKLIDDLNYINTTFASSPAYIRVNGRPLIFSFDLEGVTAIDWSRVNGSVQGNPMLIFRNNSGFTRPYTSGSYAWTVVNSTNPDDWAKSYLNSFYTTGQKYPGLLTFGAVWKGFDDRAATWGKNRVLNQNCGQVWLSTFSEMNKYLSAANSIYGMQIVTWNDYEEGSEIESGIDNCVSIAGDVIDANLAWGITGQENTVDRYIVFASVDGENLMPLAEVPVGTHELNLAAFKLSPGNYTLYVKAVGKPSLTNKISSPIPFTIPNFAPIAAVSVSVQSGTAPVTLTASSEGSTDPDGVIASRRIDFGDGTTSTSNSVSHTYTTPGIYSVTVTVTDDNGVSTSTSTLVTVKANQPPVASISITPASGTAPVTVTASAAGSTDSDGSIVSSTIYFGDGSSAQGPTESHTYDVAGMYTVRAVVTDNGGLTASASASVNVSVPFVVRVSSPADGATTNAQVRFVADTTSPSPVTAMKIYVDSVAVYSVNAPSLDTILELLPGTRSIAVQAWNQQGQVEKTPLRINVVNAVPVAKLSLTPADGAGPLTVSASTSGSVDPDGAIKSASIDFGDGYSSATASASHTYVIPGIYVVSANVTDNNGATASTSSMVTVNGVILTAPRPGTLSGTSVRILANAISTSPITAMKIYADGKSVYSTNVPSINTYINLPVGSHNVVVQAWDAAGKIYKASSTVIVN